jgi:predicted O-linked N-acetylglucosamine transferase (SPINDLY family)
VESGIFASELARAPITMKWICRSPQAGGRRVGSKSRSQQQRKQKQRKQERRKKLRRSAAQNSQKSPTADNKVRTAQSAGRIPAPPDPTAGIDDPQVLFKLGHAALRRGQFSDGERLLQAALSKGSPTGETANYLSLTFLGQQRWEQASEAVELAIEHGVNQCSAQHGMGVEFFRQGDFERAEHCFRLALRIQPQLVETRNNLANCLQRRGDLEEAIEIYRELLDERPDYMMAQYNCGVALKGLSRYSEAIDCMEATLAVDPRHVDALCNLGQMSMMEDRQTDALQWFRMVLEIEPQNHEAMYCVAKASWKLGRCEEGESWYRRAIDVKPDYYDAWNGLAAALVEVNRFTEAQECFEHVLAESPANLYAKIRLGELHCIRNDFEAGERLFRQVLEVEPSRPDVLLMMANSFRLRRKLDEAQRFVQRAIDADPERAAAYFELGHLNIQRRDIPAAHSAFDQALAVSPNDPWMRYQRAVTLPAIYRSEGEIDEYRGETRRRLEQMAADGSRLDPIRDTATTTFYLAYHGRDDDLALQLAIGEIWSETSYRPPMGDVSRADGRLRIGLASRYFSQHTVGILSAGLIAHLNRERFHVSLFAFQQESSWFEQHCDDYTLIPESTKGGARQVADQIAAADLDILIYPEIGMDPTTNTVARLRLAPAQCVMWGHPITTGIPTIDYFLSSELIEPENASEYYSETLVLFQSLPSFYFRLEDCEGSLSRSELGLPDDRTIYLCPQSSFKLHPEFDQMLDAVLDRDRNGVVALVQGIESEWDEVLRARFAASIRHRDRILFLPRVDPKRFIHLLKAGDVVLDPLHFGGGRSNYQATFVGTPVVTLPTAAMRTRVATGIYRRLGVLDTIAQDKEQFVDLAVDFANDQDRRREWSARVREGDHLIFEDQTPVRELEAFLQFVSKQHPRR